MKKPLNKMLKKLSHLWYRTKYVYYYYKCYFFHPYNKLHIKTLPPTWQDRDVVLLHAAFQCLVDFVEGERPELLKETYASHYDLYLESFGTFKDDLEYKQKAHEYATKSATELSKIKGLYYWWKFYSSDLHWERRNSHIVAMAKKDGITNELTAICSYDHILENKKLKELIDLRGHLWT